jgi:zinc protease
MHNKAPLSTSPLTFFSPEFEQRTTEQGMEVYCIHNEREHLQTITVTFLTGTSADRYPGATALMCEMLTRGARVNGQEHDAQYLATLIDDAGCSVRCSADRESVSMHVSGLATNIAHVSRIAVACLLHPTFSPVEFDRLVKKHQAERLMDVADPEFLANQALMQCTYGNHPYASPRNGTTASLAAITVEHCTEPHSNLVHSPWFVVAAGPLSLNALLDLPLITDLPTPSRPEIELVKALPFAANQALLVIKPDAVQSAIRLALPSVPFSSELYPASQVITQVLGGYTLARLFTELRENKGYTYGAYSYSDNRLQGNATFCTTSVGNEYTSDTITSIIEVLEKLANEPIPAEEWINAQQTIVGSFARSNETPQQAASLLLHCILYKLPYTYHSTYITQLQQLVPSDVHHVQQLLFDPSRASWAACGHQQVLEDAFNGISAQLSLRTPETLGV